MDGQLLALSPQAAEARAGFGDWMRGSECRDAEQRQGHPRAGDPHHQSWRLEVMPLLRDGRDALLLAV